MYIVPDCTWKCFLVKNVKLWDHSPKGRLKWVLICFPLLFDVKITFEWFLAHYKTIGPTREAGKAIQYTNREKRIARAPVCVLTSLLLWSTLYAYNIQKLDFLNREKQIPALNLTCLWCMPCITLVSTKLKVERVPKTKSCSRVTVLIAMLNAFYRDHLFRTGAKDLSLGNINFHIMQLFATFGRCCTRRDPPLTSTYHFCMDYIHFSKKYYFFKSACLELKTPVFCFNFWGVCMWFGAQTNMYRMLNPFSSGISPNFDKNGFGLRV